MFFNKRLTKIRIQAFLHVLSLCLDFVDNNQCHKPRVCTDKQNPPFQRLYQLYSWKCSLCQFWRYLLFSGIYISHGDYYPGNELITCDRSHHPQSALSFTDQRSQRARAILRCLEAFCTERK